MSQINAQLGAATAAARSGAPGPQDRTIGGGGDSLHLDINAASGKPVVLVFQDGSRQTQAMITKLGKTYTMSNSTVATLQEADLGDSPRTVDLGADGTFRVVVFQQTEHFNNGDVRVISYYGLPLAPVTKTVADTALAILLLSIGGIILAGLATGALVGSATSPLRRVAATATRVSQLPLSSGEVRMHERVPAEDTDRHTEVGQVGAALNDLLDHIDSALRARQASETQVRQFVADASHELRTPLASIRGYAELSRREREPVPTGVSHALGRIESEAERMTALVEDLLLLARLDSGRPLDARPVDVTRVLVETLSDAQAAGPDHQWKLDLPDEAVEIIGDEARLRQVTINLLANARRHTPAGTTITAGVRTEGDRARITVSDNGPGIQPDLLPRIFERFTRGDSARTRTEGSTGLGLSIVQAVTSAHHGTVEVESRPGLTRFTITLPVRPPAPETMTG
ncbi:HAMP domain-containing protein [Calidifontibacter sp. DB0510]|uniref:histidine kinase n=2 Tax=Metallococcus carri TaxID=1656884 RepID=A0A967B3A1_9MICO|nr:HAMP domain-containing protein [Metallococcus carri]NOP37880.1 HAMP domain-containing protein [Calidifontibacter sp. DB2511S]